MNDTDKLIELYNSIINNTIQPNVGITDIITIIMEHTTERKVISQEELYNLRPIFLNPDLEKIKEFNDITIMGCFLIRHLFKADDIRIDISDVPNFYQLSEYYSDVLLQL